MHPFERILLATEHTEFDTGAERIAFDLGRTCGVPVSVVFPVISNPEYEIIAPQIVAKAEQEAAAKIAELRKIADAAGTGISITTRRGEEPYREIVAEAKEQNSDLIVLRRRGKRSFLSNLLVGEMVSKVVAHAPCSALFTPRTSNMWSKGVLASIDTSHTAELVVRTAAKIARQCSIQLHIVSVLDHDTSSNRAATEEILIRARAIAEAAGVQAPGSTMLIGKPHEQILADAKAQDADLIVIGRHGENDLIPTPFGGTTLKVIGLASCPVLVMNSPKPNNSL